MFLDHDFVAIQISSSYFSFVYKINSQVNNMGLEYTKMKAMVRIQDSVINLESSKDFGSDWSWLIEPVGISKDNSFTNDGLLEQISTTKDVSDYLWYSTRYAIIIMIRYFFFDFNK